APDEPYFIGKAFGIGLDRLAPAHGLGVAAAIMAKLSAVRHVYIKRQRAVAPQTGEPVRIVARTDRAAEVGRSRIRRVSRNGALGEGEGIRHSVNFADHGAAEIDPDQEPCSRGLEPMGVP